MAGAFSVMAGFFLIKPTATARRVRTVIHVKMKKRHPKARIMVNIIWLQCSSGFTILSASGSCKYWMFFIARGKNQKVPSASCRYHKALSNFKSKSCPLYNSHKVPSSFWPDSSIIPLGNSPSLTLLYILYNLPGTVRKPRTVRRIAAAYADGIALQVCPWKYGRRVRIGNGEQAITWNERTYARIFWARVAWIFTWDLGRRGDWSTMIMII